MIPAILAILVLGVLLVYQQRAHAGERRELLTRIQTPHLAPSLAPVTEGTNQFISPDDDVAWHQAHAREE